MLNKSLFILLLLITFSYSISLAIDTDVVYWDIFNNPDSVFLKYKEPVIPDIIKERYRKEDGTMDIMLYIAAYVEIDSSGRVLSMTFDPLLNITNRYKDYDSIWIACINSIKTASKEWVFRPLFRDWLNKTKEEIDFLSERNKIAKNRPFHGKQFQLMIFEILYGSNATGMFNRMSLIRFGKDYRHVVD